MADITSKTCLQMQKVCPASHLFVDEECYPVHDEDGEIEDGTEIELYYDRLDVILSLASSYDGSLTHEAEEKLSQVFEKIRPKVISMAKVQCPNQVFANFDHCILLQYSRSLTKYFLSAINHNRAREEYFETLREIFNDVLEVAIANYDTLSREAKDEAETPEICKNGDLEWQKDVQIAVQGSTIEEFSEQDVLRLQNVPRNITLPSDNTALMFVWKLAEGTNNENKDDLDGLLDPDDPGWKFNGGGPNLANMGVDLEPGDGPMPGLTLGGTGEEPMPGLTMGGTGEDLGGVGSPGRTSVDTGGVGSPGRTSADTSEGASNGGLGLSGAGEGEAVPPNLASSVDEPQLKSNDTNLRRKRSFDPLNPPQYEGEDGSLINLDIMTENGDESMLANDFGDKQSQVLPPKPRSKRHDGTNSNKQYYLKESRVGVCKSDTNLITCNHLILSPGEYNLKANESSGYSMLIVMREDSDLKGTYTIPNKSVLITKRENLVVCPALLQISKIPASSGNSNSKMNPLGYAWLIILHVAHMLVN